ncbi:MAG: hypothetical protein HZB87_00135, partial [Desulfatitalea sp.]|nr:hypothetical protein [Desulfatitalea sp.]
EILFAGLLFFRSAMVVDGKKDGSLPLAGPTYVERRFAAVAADFQARPFFHRAERCFVQPPPFLRIQEAFNLLAKREVFAHKTKFPFDDLSPGQDLHEGCAHFKGHTIPATQTGHNIHIPDLIGGECLKSGPYLSSVLFLTVADRCSAMHAGEASARKALAQFRSSPGRHARPVISDKKIRDRTAGRL